MKALFFLRHYNDIDHVTPVIYKWVSRDHEADVVLMGDARFLDDFRLTFLAAQANTRISHIDTLLSGPELWRLRGLMLLLDRNVRGSPLRPIAAAARRFYDGERRQEFWQLVARRLLQRSFPSGGPGIVAFDWISSNSVFPVELVQSFVAIARSMGLASVSLPHGDSPHATQLVRVDELKIGPNQKFAAAAMFDRVVVPNELCAVRFRPFLNNAAIAVLGSPRYCDEWLEKLGGLLPPSPLQPSGAALKLVLFLRKRDFSIFWSEVERMVRLIAAFPGVELIIKEHTRGGWKQPLSWDVALRRLPNVRFIGAGIHSPHLLAWADVIIDLATSVAFEAVKLKKPVLAADYLHAGRSTVADHIPSTALNCRDDAYTKMEHLLSHGCADFYHETDRQAFLREIVDVPDADVLPRYTGLLEQLAC
jgi:hypothetical protein